MTKYDKYDEIEPRFCGVCGKKLVGRFRPMGFCARHQDNHNRRLTENAIAAREAGLSYGKYMVLKREGLIK